MKHLNPRQGITTLDHADVVIPRVPVGVKHLNPRQGITTFAVEDDAVVSAFGGVKHLNPRQGITTRHWNDAISDAPSKCETPKSPPGDYNRHHRS